MFFKLAVLVSGLAATIVQAAPSPTVTHGEVEQFIRRDAEAPPFIKPRAASCSFPSPPRTSSLSKAMSITGTFDGGNVRFDRGTGACKYEISDRAISLVFGSDIPSKGNKLKVESLTLCSSSRVAPPSKTLSLEDVCEDAATIKQTSGQSNIIGGGAKKAADKVIQHNGAGTVKIDSFCVQDFGKLYRSCGNCKTQYKRSALISQIDAKSGSVLAGINSNYEDVAQFDRNSIKTSSVSSICDTYQGNNSGSEPKKLTSNQSNA
ncbi:hypothetical protein AAF712_012639 [Marasmius tenuissimus]|uniref:Pectate lyase n=1 Tax=Marasmius tenuissimus TaxID=585030 RepID=A0ABR2ZG74_9AGAR